MDYADYRHLTFEPKPNGVLLVTINRPEVLNAANARLHWEFTQIWPTVDADPETRVVVVTGAGKAFSAGGDLSLVEDMARQPDALARTMREASDLVYNMINLDKPVVSAINGVAVGAGLVVALLADVSIIAETARFTDGHTRLGVAAGDHAAILWPLLCGMAKAKYYLLTADFIDGREAERIGLVTMCVPPDQVLPKALDVADRLARGSQISIRWTKRALNNWLRQAGPIFDQSLALEMLSFMERTCARASRPSARSGRRAFRQGWRQPASLHKLVEPARLQNSWEEGVDLPVLFLTVRPEAAHDRSWRRQEGPMDATLSRYLSAAVIVASCAVLSSCAGLNHPTGTIEQTICGDGHVGGHDEPRRRLLDSSRQPLRSLLSYEPRRQRVQASHPDVGEWNERRPG